MARRRKNHTVVVEVCGIEGIGKTKADARADAESKIRHCLENPDPVVIHWRGLIDMISPCPTGGWSIRHVADENGFRDRCGAYVPRGTLAEVESRVRLDLAQRAWKPEDGDECELLQTDRERIEFRGWVEFQRRYSAARAVGLGDMDAFDYAHQNPRRPELWRHGFPKPEPVAV